MLFFAKTDAGINDDEVGGVTSLYEHPFRLFKGGPYFTNDVIVVRFGLHGSWFALHVHDADGASGAKHHVHHGWVAKPRHVVDHVGPCFQGRLCDRVVSRVNGDKGVRTCGSKALNHREDALEFGFHAHRFGAGPCRFPADVHPTCTGVNHGSSSGHSFLIHGPAVGVKGIIGRVEDAHDLWPCGVS